MKHLINLTKEYFKDKSDDYYVKVTSKLEFFDAFLLKNKKCNIKIPETIILNEGINNIKLILLIITNN